MTETVILILQFIQIFITGAIFGFLYFKTHREKKKKEYSFSEIDEKKITQQKKILSDIELLNKFTGEVREND